MLRAVASAYRAQPKPRQVIACHENISKQHRRDIAQSGCTRAGAARCLAAAMTGPRAVAMRIWHITSTAAAAAAANI